MYLLPCPACENSLPVAPSKAGESLVCPACNGSLQVPKLGELKLLPPANEPAQEGSGSNAYVDDAPVARVGFLLAGFTATVCLLIASFCGLRWFLLPVPNSTARHIETTRADMESFTPAELIRAYEEMEKTPIDLVLPYVYKEKENFRNRWGRNALYSGSAGLMAVAVAVVFATSGRKRRH